MTILSALNLRKIARAIFFLSISLSYSLWAQPQSKNQVIHTHIKPTEIQKPLSLLGFQLEPLTSRTELENTIIKQLRLEKSKDLPASQQRREGGENFLSGNEGGHGGGGHYCPSRLDNKLEFFDFFEGRNPLLNNIPVWQDNKDTSRDEYLLKVLAKIFQVNSVFGELVLQQLNEILSTPDQEIFMSLNLMKPQTGDDYFFIEPGCEFVVVAKWHERFNRLIINSTAFKMLSPMGQAGLLIHEVLYKIGRDRVDLKNSNRVRSVVAKLFSHVPIDYDDLKNIIGKPRTISWEVIRSRLPHSGMCSLEFEVRSLWPDVTLNDLAIDLSFQNFRYGIHEEEKYIPKVDFSKVVRVPCSYLKDSPELILYYRYRGARSAQEEQMKKDKRFEDFRWDIPFLEMKVKIQSLTVVHHTFDYHINGTKLFGFETLRGP